MITSDETLNQDEKPDSISDKSTTTSGLQVDDPPNDDQALAENAFLDILWQDENGNSALMMAAAENRILHVKRILGMASERGKLYQVLNMQNVDGLTALKMAVEAGNETCAMLITRFSKESQKSKPHFPNMAFKKTKNREACENDITVEFDDMSSPTAPFACSRPFDLEHSSRRFSRNRINKDLRRVPTTDYVLKMNRSDESKNTMMIQRSMSGDQLTPTSTSPSLTTGIPNDCNKSISVGDRFRSIFANRKKMDLDSFGTRRHQDYTKNDEDNCVLQYGPSPSNNSSDPISLAEMFHSPSPHARFPLPALTNLRRRTSSAIRSKSGQDH